MCPIQPIWLAKSLALLKIGFLFVDVADYANQ